WLPGLHAGRDVSIPLSPPPCWHLLSFVFLKAATLTEVRWHLHIALICISLIVGASENSFPYAILSVSYSSEKCLFRSFAH
ncbi:hypothetical protein ACQP3C_30530, partial [Escherichia coli]